MTLSCFDSAQLPAMPWKNGGGVTHEIACLPAGSSLQDFHWRLSIAEVASNGPFSAFAGVDRIITLLEGDGMHLRSNAGCIDHALSTPLQPFAFCGDVALEAFLRCGPSLDFNVMVQRSFGSAHVALWQHRWSLPAQGALLVRCGQWRLTGSDGSCQRLSAGGQDGAYWSHLAGTVSAEPLTRDAQLLAVTITPHVAA